MRRQDGFSLVELMITMVITILTIAGAAAIFVPLMNQFKQQSKIAETNIEGMVGLELLRVDIESAGYGLPWMFQNDPTSATPITYSEAASAPASNYNDASTPTKLPRAIFSGNNVTGLANILDNTDYLVIKSLAVGRSDIGQKWTYVTTGSAPKAWPSDNLNNGNNVIVIRPSVAEKKFRELVMNNATYYTTFSSGGLSAAFSPSKSDQTFIVYGVDDGSLRMPFNRADYFVSTQNVPTRCAPNTAVLRKSVLSHTDGSFSALPLLDCVADMQVTYWLDTSDPADGLINWPPVDDISALDSPTIRNQLMEIRVYIVAHEGQRDTSFDFSMNNTRNPFFTVTENLTSGPVGNTRNINFANLKNLVGDPDYKYYRWKLYTMVVKPQNLR